MSLGLDKQQDMRDPLPSDVRLNNIKKHKMGHGVDKESGHVWRQARQQGLLFQVLSASNGL
jgi:hypothetical protein